MGYPAAVSCGNGLYPFQATDYEGAWIRWERRGYESHVRKRPEIDEWHDAIQQTLADPSVVVELPDGGRGYYRQGVLPTRYGTCYLFVVVRWNGALGDVATAFPTDEIKPFVRILRMSK